jgi:DNA-directed RNA polymerase specialized sigma24 family protein
MPDKVTKSDVSWPATDQETSAPLPTPPTVIGTQRFYGGAKPDIDDLLAEAALRTLRARPFLEAPQQLLELQKSILSALLADFSRRSSVRRREGNIMHSLQQDFTAGAGAQFVDRRMSGEAAAIDLELKRRLARLVARLPVAQRHVVWLWMQGVSLKEQERISGRSVCRQWRSALDRLRQQLEEGESS